MRTRRYQTITTAIKPTKANKELIEYLHSIQDAYQLVVNDVIVQLRNNSQITNNELLVYLADKYDLLKRTYVSILYEARRQWHLMNQPQYEQDLISNRVISYFHQSIESMKSESDVYMALLKTNQLTDGEPYQLLRKHITEQETLLNRLREQETSTNVKSPSVRPRITYTGSRSEIACNSMFQLHYDDISHDFTVRMRRDFQWSTTFRPTHVQGKLDLGENTKVIRAILKGKFSLLNYSITNVNGVWYVECSYSR